MTANQPATSQAITYKQGRNKQTSPTRKYFTRQRRALSAQQRQQFARQASMQLHKLQSQLPKRAKVGIYYDDFGELPTQVILDWCHRLGYQVYLPVVGSLGRQDKRLRFSPINRQKLTALPTYSHPLGMKQHHHQLKLWASQLDVIFCPLVAVDKIGIRMGMGGGYYDRTLAKPYHFAIKKHAQPKPLKVAWCYDFQLVDKLDRQSWDIPMDMAITPTRLIRY